MGRNQACPRQHPALVAVGTKHVLFCKGDRGFVTRALASPLSREGGGRKRPRGALACSIRLRAEKRAARGMIERGGGGRVAPQYFSGKGETLGAVA